VQDWICLAALARIQPIPAAARSESWIWGRSLAGIAGSNPAGTRMSVSCECCVLSGTGLWVGLITRPEESYRTWCVSECDREASIMRRPWPTGGCGAMAGEGGWELLRSRLFRDVKLYLWVFPHFSSATVVRRTRLNIAFIRTLPVLLNVKDEAYLFYIRTQCVPRCKHSPLRL
jgi:hypothetical protein